MKRWRDGEIDAMQRELSMLRRLRELGFGGAVYPVENPPGIPDACTCYPWVPSPEAGQPARDVQREMAKLLADLHRRSADEPFAGSRVLGGLARARRSLGSPLLAARDRALMHRVIRILERRWPELLELPTAIVHGDPDASNLVGPTGHGRLVDWEFSRVDIRSLDLAASLAPRRTRQGRYVRASWDRRATFVRCYQERAGGPPEVLAAERRLLPTSTLAYWTLVLSDQIDKQSRWVPEVLRVVRWAWEDAEREF